MRYVFLCACMIALLFSSQPASHEVLTKVANDLTQELGEECTALGYEEYGGLDKVMLQCGDLYFSADVQGDNVLSNNYSTAIERQYYQRQLVDLLNSSNIVGTPYSDFYSSNIVTYIIVDDDYLQDVTPEICKQWFEYIIRNNPDAINYVCITSVPSADLCLFEQLSSYWSGVGADTRAFYERVGNYTTVTFTLYDGVPEDTAISDELSKLL